jgi:hypothetical protein
MLHPFCRLEPKPKCLALMMAVLWWAAVTTRVWSFPLVTNVRRCHEIRWRHRESTSSSFQSFQSEETTDDAEEARRELIEMMIAGDTAPSTTPNDPLQRQQRGVNEDPLMGYSLQELEAFAASRGHKSKVESPSLSTSSPSLRDEDDDDDDVLFLEPDAYVQSGDRLNADGSLSSTMLGRDAPWPDSSLDATAAAATVDPQYREAMTNFLETVPTAPVAMEIESTCLDPSFAGEFTENQSMDELWKAIQQKGANPMDFYDPSLSETLHQQVFANEEGFLNNSPAFLESLTDGTKLDKALVERRGRAYRQRQEEALAALEAQMDEFMAQLQEAQDNETENEKRQSRCGQCQALLSDDEKQAPMQSKVQEATIGLLCRVCYTDILIAESKRAEQQEKLEREQRARSVLQSFRQTGVVITPPSSTTASSRPPLPNRRVYTSSRPRPPGGTPSRTPVSGRPPPTTDNATRRATGASAGDDETRQ